jgi:hypothetical protein
MEIKMNARRLRRVFTVVALMLASTAQAQLFRAYLSSTGSDANLCTLQAPCRLLPAALTAVAEGGEIWMLNSANYNTSTVNLTKSVSIIAVPGAVGSVVAIAGPAVRIDTANLFISFRNVVFTALAGGGGTSGIEITANSQVNVYDSLIANLPANGVVAGTNASVRIVNSILRNNDAWGVYANNNAHVSISGSQLLGNLSGGVIAFADVDNISTRIMVSDSVISGGNEGVLAWNKKDSPSSLARITVTRSTVDDTSTAIVARTIGNANALVVMSRSMIVKNGSAWNIDGSGAKIRTMQNNHITNNGPSTGALTPTALQ